MADRPRHQLLRRKAMEQKVTEQEAEILKLWKEGQTGQAIADQLGITRNAVMGKLHRLRERRIISYKSVATRLAAIRHAVRVRERAKKAEAEPAPQPIEEKPQKVEVVDILPEMVEEEPPPKPDRNPVTLMNLGPLSCRYVINNGVAKDFLFCNAVKKVGSSYCEEHHTLCHVPQLHLRRKEKPNDAAT